MGKKEDKEAGREAKEVMKKSAQLKLEMIRARVEERLKENHSIVDELQLLKQMRLRYELHADECQRHHFFPTQTMALDCAEKCSRLHTALLPKLGDGDKEIILVPVSATDVEDARRQLLDIN